jgi:hypothetical protein
MPPLPGRARGFEDDARRLRQLEQRADRSHGTTFGHETPERSCEAWTARSAEERKACGRRLFDNGETRTRTGDTTIFSGPRGSGAAQ